MGFQILNRAEQTAHSFGGIIFRKLPIYHLRTYVRIPILAIFAVHPTEGCYVVFMSYLPLIDPHLGFMWCPN